jgi:RNA polymerase sigma-70 factor (ECF subfamily)
MKPIESHPAAKPAWIGKQDELAHRFELFRPYLLAMAKQQLSPCPIVDVSGSDLVQETYLAAQQQWNNFRGVSANELLSWLRTILRCQISRRRRERKKALAAEAAHSRRSALGAQRLEPADTSASPDQQMEREEDYLRLLGLLNEMPELKKQILEGHIGRNETYREIGERLGMSEDAVRMALRRALEQLRGYFQAAATLCLQAKQNQPAQP